jgi:ABC-type glutathione transport system ATPase component
VSTERLRARHLGKRYRRRSSLRWSQEIHALHEVDLTLEPGATLAVVGASGSGKSTLSRCLALLETPSSGEVWLDGQNLSSLTGRALVPFRRQIQLVFQDPATALNPRLAAAEIVAEPLVVAGRGTRHEQRRRARELLGRVGLPASVEGRRPLELSGGQRQRLAIARALALEPTVLILDEALTGLDLSLQAQMVSLVQDLQASRAVACLYVSHDLDLMGTVADDMAVMHAGQIVERGPTSELLTRPQHARTREMVAALRSAAGVGDGS